MKSLSKILKTRKSAVMVVVLVFALLIPIFAIPFAQAQTWTIYIDPASPTSSGRIRMEVRLDNSRRQISFANISLGVKYPGAADFTYLGPFSTNNGRYDYTYNNWSQVGEYQFQYVVPPQSELPTNPATTDGKWYSDIISRIVNGSVVISIQSANRLASTGVIRGEMRINNVQRSTTFANVTLNVKPPGGAWTILGPYSTTNGRVDRTYNFSVLGVYQFQYVVPPQDGFPVNTTTADGNWYSAILDVNWNWAIFVSVPTSSARPNLALSPVRMEVRFADILQPENVSGVVLNVQYPNGTIMQWDGTLFSNVTLGRVDASFMTGVNGTHTFTYVVPPQGNLPTNPATTDGKWYGSAVKLVEKIYVKPYTFVDAIPNPVGVGQPTLLFLGITDATANDDQGWEGLTAEIWYPDGRFEVRPPVRTDATGGTGQTFIPDVAGNYTVRCHFPEQQNNALHTGSGGAGAYYAEGYSSNLTLVVTEEPQPAYPWFQPPTEYWTRPIDSQIREWGKIAGPSFNTEFQDAPESAHVLWAQRLANEGLIGGTVDTSGRTSRIVIGGVLIYTTDPMDNVSQYYLPRQTIAVDLRTGMELWEKNDTTIYWGQLYYHPSINRNSVYAYAWSFNTTYPNATTPRDATAYAYDVFDGNMLYRIQNFPEGPMSFGGLGEMLVYQVNFTDNRMYVWNSSWSYYQGKTGMQEAWNARGTNYNAATKFATSSGWQDNITLPSGLAGTIQDISWNYSSGELRVVGVDITGSTSRSWAFSMEKSWQNRTERAVSVLWDVTKTFAVPGGAATTQGPIYIGDALSDCVQLRYQASTGKYWAFSLETGNLLWSSEDFTETADGENALNLPMRNEKVAYGMLYTAGAGGSVYAYDVHKGLNWTYNAFANASAVSTGSFYWSGVALVSDGKVYVAIGEPAVGAPFMCFDAMSGELIWRADGMFRQTWGGPNVIIGDSVIATLDTYDMRVYAIGKGPSTTTVSAPATNVPFETAVTIKGTVMDNSPGTAMAGLGTYSAYIDINRSVPNFPNNYVSAMQLRFPKGVPAVSEQSMSDWMKYVYKNLPYPTDVKGVEVRIDVLDSNGNYYEVGRTVTDANGAFVFEFKPDISGEFEVYAFFEGSASYFGSSAKATIQVDEELPPPPPPVETTPTFAETYILPAVIGIIVAIAIIGALLALLILRKP